MVHDIESAAKRLFGFLKKDPNPTMTTLLRWLSLIEFDQDKDRMARYKSRFEGFDSRDKAFLKRYEAEIMILFEKGHDPTEILHVLKDRFSGAKRFVSIEALIRFLNRMEAFNG